MIKLTSTRSRRMKFSFMKAKIFLLKVYLNLRRQISIKNKPSFKNSLAAKARTGKRTTNKEEMPKEKKGKKSNNN